MALHILRLAFLVAVMAGIAAVLVFLSGLTTTQHACASAADCTGSGHPDCDGIWQCKSNSCQWTCGKPVCLTPRDCEGLPHPECDGSWSCEDSQCAYGCQVGDREHGLTYSVGECQEGVRTLGRVDLTPAADGIMLEQTLDYVCCAKVELGISAEGNLIRINETNVGEMCRCQCAYDISAEVKVLPGTYKVEVYGVGFEGSEMQKLGEGTVTVGKTAGRVLFIEQHLSQTGRNIAGSYPFMFIDFPTYSFDEGTRVLEGMLNFDPSRVAAIFGTGMSLSGDVGSGAGTALVPVNGTPFTHGEYSITRIWEDGTVALHYNNQTITLSPGQVWSEKTVEEKADSNHLGLIRITSNNTITNHGFIEIAKISEWPSGAAI